MFSSDPNLTASNQVSSPSIPTGASSSPQTSGPSNIFGLSSSNSTIFPSSPAQTLFSNSAAGPSNSNQNTSFPFSSNPNQSLFAPSSNQSAFASSQSLFGPSSNQSAFASSQNLFSPSQDLNSPQPSLFGSSSQTVNSNQSNLFKTSSSPNQGFSFTSAPSNGSQPVNNNLSVFSSTPATSNTTGFGFGGSQASPSFGGASTTSTSLFGATPSSSTPFGGSSSTTPSGGSLFGGSSSTTPSGGGLFGGSSSTTPSGGSLFGSSSGTSTLPQRSCFCTSSSQNIPNTGGSLFNTNSTQNSWGGPQTTTVFNPPSSFPSPFGTSNPVFNTPSTSPSPFGMYNPGFAPNNIFGQITQIPYFEEIPAGMNRIPFDIQLTRTGFQADLLVKVNDFDVYHLSSKIMKKFSDCFVKKESSGVQEIEIETPFPNSMFEVLFWMVYSSDSKLIDYLSSLKRILEVYASFNMLQVKSKQSISKMLINFGKSRNLFTSIQNFPESLNREFIDFEFISELVKSIGSGLFNSNNTIKCAMLLEWLSERNCKSLSDQESLESSEDFQKVSNFLSLHSFFPSSLNDYAVLSKRYPISSKVFSLQMILKGFNLLQI
jgi:hypothetical protein